MKIIAVLCLLATSAWAHPLPLSPTFEIRPAIESLKWVYLPSLNAWRAETTWKNEKMNLTVIRSTPKTWANEFSVKNEWARQNQWTSSNTKVLKDQSCNRSGRASFICERTINEDNQFLAIEKLHWNEKSDLVLVRLSTTKNREVLADFAKQLEIKAKSRLPASQKKAVKK